MYETLKEQFKYYINNQNEFVNKYNGKSIILKDFVVVGIFDNEWEAAKNAKEKYSIGTYIVQRVAPGVDAYTIRIASNFIFAGVK